LSKLFRKQCQSANLSMCNCNFYWWLTLESRKGCCFLFSKTFSTIKAVFNFENCDESRSWASWKENCNVFLAKKVWSRFVSLWFVLTSCMMIQIESDLGLLRLFLYHLNRCQFFQISSIIIEFQSSIDLICHLCRKSEAKNLLILLYNQQWEMWFWFLLEVLQFRLPMDAIAESYNIRSHILWSFSRT